MVLGIAPVMMGFIGMMYSEKNRNTLIIICSIITFVSLSPFYEIRHWLGDEQFMKGKIPHHASVIMTSKNSNIKIWDGKVKNGNNSYKNGLAFNAKSSFDRKTFS